MPSEQGYQPQVAPGGTTPLPMVDAESQGAGLGRAVEQLGGALHRNAIQAYGLERKQRADAEAADVNARLTAQRLDDAKFIADGRQNWKPGHAAAVEARLAAQRQGIASGIVEDATRNQTLARFDDYAASVVSSEHEFETIKNGALTVGRLVQANNTSTNIIRSSTDPDVFPREYKAHMAAIQDTPGLDEAGKEKWSRDYTSDAFGGRLDGWLDQGQPKLVLAALASDEYSKALTPQQVDHYRSAAEVEMRREAAVAAQQSAAAEKALRDEVQTAKTLNGAGAVQDDKHLGTLASGLDAIGDHGGATELRLMMKTNRMAPVAAAMTPQQRDAHIGELSALAKPTTDQQIELNYYRQVKGSLDSQYNGDRAGFFARNGNPPPALSPSDPGSFAARKRWAAATGAPVLTNNEAAALQEQAAKSPKERLAVANQLAMFGGWDAVTAARRVSPTDPMLARLVVLRPGDREGALKGQEARKANPDLIDGKLGNDARDDFNDRMGSAAALLSPSEYGATFEVARNLYADWAVTHGVHGYDKSTFNSFVHRALGGSKRPGSGEWQGGVGTWGRAQVLLPQGATQREFDIVLTRVNWGAADRNAPVWANGMAMTPAQVRGFTPVQRPDGWYEFHDPRGTVVTVKGGGVWRLNIAQLAAKVPK